MNNFAFVTIATKKQFLICALKNGQRLNYVNSQYPLVILTTNELYQEFKKLILDNSCESIQIQIIENLATMSASLCHRYVDTINKLQVLRLTDYDKILFIDSDFLLLKNIDYFLKQEMPDSKPFMFFKSADSLNRGFGAFFFARPNLELFNTLIDSINKNELKFVDDESFFDEYFSDCHTDIPGFLHELKIIHFCGGIKPWELEFKTNFMYNLFFNTDFLNYNKLLDQILLESEFQNYLTQLAENFIRFNVLDEKLIKDFI